MFGIQILGLLTTRISILQPDEAKTRLSYLSNQTWIKRLRNTWNLARLGMTNEKLCKPNTSSMTKQCSFKFPRKPRSLPKWYHYYRYITQSNIRWRKGYTAVNQSHETPRFSVYNSRICIRGRTKFELWTLFFLIWLLSLVAAYLQDIWLDEVT